MSLVSWAKKELSRFGLLQKNRKLLLPQRRLLTPPAKSSIPSPGKEVVVAADLRCDECQRRVSALLSQIEDVESMVFHVFEKKVTVIRKSTAQEEEEDSRQ